MILCHPADAAARWLDATWRELGVPDVELVTVEQLVFSRAIVHRLGNTGDTGCIQLADGRALRLETIAGLINRVRHLPTDHFARADAVDREYATAELHALMLAWLNGVAGRVLNPARPLDLGGDSFPRATVMHLAATAGLPAASWCASASRPYADAANEASTTHAPVVFDGRVFGSLVPRSIQDGCRRLAALLGVPLLQVLLNRAPDGQWRFVDAHGGVDFIAAGRPLAAAIAQAISR